MSTASVAVIETRGLVKSFADAQAVDGIDLDVPAGGVYGFLGPNGAGKTTTIRILAGLLWPTRGTARILGETVRPGAPVLRRVGCLIERPAVYPYLTATDNLLVFATARGMPSAGLAAAVAEALDRVGLASVARRKAGGFSTGMLQRLALATAFLGRPELVILDEPTNGLDPNGVVDVRLVIAALAREGSTVFLSTHVLPEVEQLCDRIAILRDGRIVAAGPATDVLGAGERVVARFDHADDALRAHAALTELGRWVATREEETTVVVDATAADASTVNRALAERGVFAAEVRVRRQSLEAVFRELTIDAEAPAAPGRRGVDAA